MVESDLITSPGNPKVKQIRKLRDRKEREQTGLFYIEGLRIVGEAFQSGADIDLVIYAPELLTSGFGKDLLEKIRGSGTPVLRLSAEVFRSITLKEGPQGIAALVRQRWENLDHLPLDRDWVALDSVADPGNLGTILRTNDAVGGAGIILLDHSTDPYDPTAVRASMGAVFSQRLVRAAFDDFLQWKLSLDIPLIGTSDAADQDYHRYPYPHPMVLLMGSEREGLNEQHQAACDKVVAIPMVGSSDSLNLSVATGIVLYEIFNQKRSAEFDR